MKSAMPDPIPAIRQALGIDTWGMDLFRMKRRIGEICRRLDALEEGRQPPDIDAPALDSPKGSGARPLV